VAANSLEPLLFVDFSLGLLHTVTKGSWDTSEECAGAHIGSVAIIEDLYVIDIGGVLQGYYYPTMYRDAKEEIEKYDSCQIHAPVPRLPKTLLTSIMSLWPFYQWGLDILGPLPKGLGKLKFIIAAISYFTKWMKAKPLAKTTYSCSITKTSEDTLNIPRVSVAILPVGAGYLKTPSRGSWQAQIHHCSSRLLHQVNGSKSISQNHRVTEIPQPLPIAPSPVPPSDDAYLIVRQAHTPVNIDTESEPKEAPLETEEFEASKPSDTRITSPNSTTSSDFTTLTACMAVRTKPTLSSGMSARIVKAVALSPSSFRKRYRSSYETPSPSSSLTLPIRRGIREEEAAPEGQQQAFLVVDTTANKPSGLGYGALKRHPMDSTSYTDILIDVPPVRVHVQTPPLPKWSFGSLLVSPSFLAGPTPVASLMTTPATIIAVDRDEFLEVRVQLEFHGSIPHDYTECLDALPLALFQGYDRDLRELYTRSREVRDEIFS
nr:reverse transcriptase domain-containing protein [Tanacetum cinerariifolium]